MMESLSIYTSITSELIKSADKDHFIEEKSPKEVDLRLSLSVE